MRFQWQPTLAINENLMHIAITLLFALLIACTPQPLEQFDPEATYVGGDSACAKFSEIFPNLRQSSLFDDEVREQVKLIRDLSVNSEPSIRRASEEFLRSFSFEEASRRALLEAYRIRTQRQ